jgi:SAM-dependent methyltransferase
MAKFFEHSKTGRAYNFLRNIYYLTTVIPKLNGSRKFTCNVCEYEGKFYSFGYPPRFNARCPSCGSLERHRQLYQWVTVNSDFVQNADLLHFAPEGMMRKILSGKARSYRGADLSAGKADIVLDIEEIELPDESVDLIVCSHVLEHVDDKKALSEMFRILRPGGKALLMFPIIEAWPKTYENSNVTSRADRIQHFGQHDHVRFYGGDVASRITDAGFVLTRAIASEPDVGRYALARGETIFIAEKTNSVS